MRLAIEEARQSKLENPRSNPKVGAVLVKADRVLGSAHRGELGAGDHAEFTLFQKKLSNVDISGSTLYTTLEPCTSRKKHKPCAEWVIERGISRVVIGMLDPNPVIYNLGVIRLKERGIEISYFDPELREEIKTENKVFIEQFYANPDLTGRSQFNYNNERC